MREGFFVQLILGRAQLEHIAQQGHAASVLHRCEGIDRDSSGQWVGVVASLMTRTPWTVLKPLAHADWLVPGHRAAAATGSRSRATATAMAAALWARWSPGLGERLRRWVGVMIRNRVDSVSPSTSADSRRTSASGLAPYVTTRTPSGRGGCGCGVVDVDAAHVAGPCPIKQLTLGARHTIEATDTLEVRRTDISDEANRGAGDFLQQGNLTKGVHAHFDHPGLRLRGHRAG